MKIEAIDLGLSVKWADRNLSAKSPKGKGTLMSWGTPKEKEESLYPTENPREKFVDVVEKELGEPWRMPTAKDFEELVEKCLWEWHADESVYKVTGPNGNYIILPTTGLQGAAVMRSEEEFNCDNGYYWSKTIKGGKAVNLFFTNEVRKVGISEYMWHTRQAIRPVYPKEETL